uniref:Uncharacterized protein AlNc14C21G2218 n=1 Tax=Albugo laibachii Nc14 TaxID=890382 RepID=F0W5Q3_9STRA|nr:conserved hypothetical protein [Albugo laibachii Nc14]|eukprot:CCA16444.1 conserved hypothetical protein [Albugo laibachii Nc14]
MDSLDAFMATLNIPDVQPLEPAPCHRKPSNASLSDQNKTRNRRYRRLQQLLINDKEHFVDNQWYFSDQSMKEREPALYHLYVGQYIETNHKIQEQLYKVADKQSLLLSSFLIDTYDRKELIQRRSCEERRWSMGQKQPGRNENDTEDEDKIAQRRQDLVDLMSQRYLDGLDHEYIDYEAIDADTALDDFIQQERDEQDAYFDTYDAE